MNSNLASRNIKEICSLNPCLALYLLLPEPFNFLTKWQSQVGNSISPVMSLTIRHSNHQESMASFRKSFLSICEVSWYDICRFTVTEQDN